jgi:hypothetical protein
VLARWARAPRWRPSHARLPLPWWAVAAAILLLLTEELVLRGILQRALPLPRVGAAVVQLRGRRRFGTAFVIVVGEWTHGGSDHRPPPTQGRRWSMPDRAGCRVDGRAAS